MTTEGALRLHVAADGVALAPGAVLALPGPAAAHVKVRRLQPGATVRLFDGGGGDWPAVVQSISREGVQVRLADAPIPPPAAELPAPLAIAFGMPANERMDALVEKATELGVAALWPLMTERSVLRLQGERAERRRAHWQAVAAAACEQCGRARVPTVHAVRSLPDWLGDVTPVRDVGGANRAPGPARWMLSTEPEAPRLTDAVPAQGALLVSGPEGGFSPAEREALRGAGFAAVSLGPRILRADTAPLAALAWLSMALAPHPPPKSDA